MYGETGTGKSLFTRVLANKLKTAVYKKSPSGYWNGYKGEKLVVIDDMTREDWEYIKHNLKKWLDYETFVSSPLRDRLTKDELKPGDPIDPSKYTLVITSYKPLSEFLEQERAKDAEKGEKGLNDRDVQKIERLLEVHQMVHTDIEEIGADIEKILEE